MAELDSYIDWATAKLILSDLMKDAVSAMAFCDMMLIKAGSVNVYDDVVSAMLGSISLTNEQVNEVSSKYLELASKVKMSAQQLKQSEVIRDVR